MNREKPNILLSLAATVPQTYRQAVLDAGGTPVGGYLPNCVLPADFDGLLLGGGGDLDPSWYGEENHGSHEIDSARDQIEFQLVQQAIAHRRPVFGICRGIQVLNAFLGGTLIQDLGVSHSMTEGEYCLHATCTKVGSRIADWYGRQVTVNSGHHQAIRQVAPHCTVTQWACDGVIEAIEHDFLPILAVQWHPERMCGAMHTAGTADGMLFFEAFIASCRKEWAH